MKYGTRKVNVGAPVHAVKAHREKRYSYTQYGHEVEVRVQLHIPAALLSGRRRFTHRLGGWVGSKVGSVFSC